MPLVAESAAIVGAPAAATSAGLPASDACLRRMEIHRAMWQGAGKSATLAQNRGPSEFAQRCQCHIGA
eukprot:8023266-Pyramimonas_sp.AAC.2